LQKKINEKAFIISFFFFYWRFTAEEINLKIIDLFVLLFGGW
jgi:hypothetical protein